MSELRSILESIEEALDTELQVLDVFVHKELEDGCVELGVLFPALSEEEAVVYKVCRNTSLEQLVYSLSTMLEVAYQFKENSDMVEQQIEDTKNRLYKLI